LATRSKHLHLLLSYPYHHTYCTKNQLICSNY
jgi:hypothetical protein